MPLNDHEQKILDEIEAQFYRQDPKLADRVRTASVGLFSGASTVRAVIGFVVGLAITAYFFPQDGGTPIAAVGFAIMVLSTWAGIRGLNRDSSGGGGMSPLARLRSKWQRGA
jgi:hypothetical protein